MVRLFYTQGLSVASSTNFLFFNLVKIKGSDSTLTYLVRIYNVAQVQTDIKMLIFSNSSVLTYVLGAKWNCLIEMVL